MCILMKATIHSAWLDSVYGLGEKEFALYENDLYGIFMANYKYQFSQDKLGLCTIDKNRWQTITTEIHVVETGITYHGEDIRAKLGFHVKNRLPFHVAGYKAGNKLVLPIIYHVNDVLIVDSDNRNINVKQFVIPNPKTFKKIVNYFVKNKVITEDRYVSTYRTIFNKYLSNLA